MHCNKCPFKPFMCLDLVLTMASFSFSFSVSSVPESCSAATAPPCTHTHQHLALSTSNTSSQSVGESEISHCWPAWNIDMNFLNEHILLDTLTIKHKCKRRGEKYQSHKGNFIQCPPPPPPQVMLERTHMDLLAVMRNEQVCNAIHSSTFLKMATPLR